MIGTIISSTFTVAFFRRTITAASATSTMVVYSTGMWNAFWKADVTELATTWLMPHQQIRPDRANSTARREYRFFLPLFFSLA